jgi:hypothetical protein
MLSSDLTAHAFSTLPIMGMASMDLTHEGGQI